MNHMENSSNNEQLSAEEKADIQRQVKRQTGLDLDISKLGITAEKVSGAIMNLLNQEREKKNAKIGGIFIRAFLVDKKKFIRSGTKKKLRLKTYWYSADGNLNVDQNERKLGEYASEDNLTGGMISRMFVQIITEYQAGNSDLVPDINEACIYFQFEIKNGEPDLACNFVNGLNPENIVTKIDFNEIFKGIS